MISHSWFVTFVSAERYSGWVRIPYYREASLPGQTSDDSVCSCSASSRPEPYFRRREGSRAENSDLIMTDGLDRLKVLINSSTPVVVMETSEEMHAVKMVRSACAELNMATFEWSIADGLVRSGSNTPPDGQRVSLQARIDQSTMLAQAGHAYAEMRTALSPGNAEAERLARAMKPATGPDGTAAATGAAIYNTREPVQALANM